MKIAYRFRIVDAELLLGGGEVKITERETMTERVRVSVSLVSELVTAAIFVCADSFFFFFFRVYQCQMAPLSP